MEIRSVKEFDLMRVVMGFIAAPIIPAVVFYIYSYIVGDELSLAFFIVIAAIAGYPVVVFLGVPLYIILRRRSIEKLYIYFALGLVLGAAAYLGVFLPRFLFGDPGVGHAMRNTVGLIFVSSLCGGIAGITFWLIAVWRNGNIMRRRTKH